MKYIVDFHDHISQDDIDNYFAEINASVIKNFSKFEKTYLVECSSAPDLNSDLHSHIIDDDSNTLKLLSTTIISDQSWYTKKLDGEILTISTSNTNDWWKNYVVLNPEFDNSEYKIDRNGKGYTVYVLDSGCDVTHTEFAGRPVTNLFSFNNDFTDTNGHGTAIASVITGSTCGITEATVKSVKIFHNGVPTRQSDLVNALDAIASDFYASNMDFAIINCSWTISKNLFIEQKLQALINMGMLVVAAAGNSGIPIEDVTPASMEEAITIGSYSETLTPSDFSDYSNSPISVTPDATNHGALDGWAPGENIYCAGVDGTYKTISGTSIAAGIHSAVCAYNLSQETLAYQLSNELHSYLKKLSLMRSNLLDLSDPKYQYSTNLVSTIVDHVVENDSGIKLSMRVQGTSGNYYYTRIFNPRTTYKLEILTDLPENTSVEANGIFKGVVPEVSSVTLQSVPMIYTSTDGKVIEFVFEIITVPSTFIIGEDTTGDPVLDLKLQVEQCYPTSPCEPLEGCNDNCAPSFNYCGIDFDKNCQYATRCVCKL
jgi:hypothetical protein